MLIKPKIMTTNEILGGQCKCSLSRIQKDIVKYGRHCCIDGGGRGKAIDLANTIQYCDDKGNVIHVEAIKCH